ncbi:acyltransferase family protein [Undibacterium sp. TJN19]|uniref:acyltransferase family protein n=1 Tax=Undibacterium sp. TJN19 TaxID=3413055 RepID=UPI003BF19C02
MNYRKEIDGLRALAVLPVILFHAGFTAFSGGFVGVDIFFVISGYLITTIVVTEMEQGSFSLLNFYERRARRILPALFFVMLCTLPFAWIWMLPQDLKDFSESLVAVSLFASNIFFCLTNGYFDAASELKPLINTWSLAVEEQYYVLFPLFLMLAWKLGKKCIISLLLIVAVISIGTAHWVSSTHPSFAFYLLPTRGFEILIGALVSLYINYKSHITLVSQRASQLVSLIGLVLILYAIFTFDYKTPSPSLYTLIPTIGAGLVLVFANTKNLVGKLLGSKAFVGIGLISYSAYLWHQPLLAFARLRSLDGLTNINLILLCLTALLFGYWSWKYVENPFRNKQKISRKILFILSLVLTFTFIVVGLIGWKCKDLNSRLSKQQKVIARFQNYDFTQTLRRYTCYMEPENTYHNFKDECYGNKTSDAYLIWGDSYAAASSKGIRTVHNDIIQLTASACPPLIDTSFVDRPNCLYINNFVKENIQKLQPKKIFLQSNWYTYKREDVIGNLSKTIEFIKIASPNSKIIIIGSAPQWEPTLPIFLSGKNITLSQEEYIQMPTYKKLKDVDRRLMILANTNKVEFISLLDSVCIGEKCLAVTKYKSEFWLTAWDNGHLTEAGSVYIYTKMKKLINN